MSSQMINHDFHGNTIQQRSSDGYFGATAMCKANGKRFVDYRRNQSTQEFFAVASRMLKMPIESEGENSHSGEFKGLIEVVNGGNYAGTWVHPQVSINLAQWCSPEFAFMVTEWVFELMTTGKVALKPSTDDTLTWQLRLFGKLAETTRMATSSQYMLVRAIGNSHGIDTSFIPDYTNESVTKALTTLLKEGDYAQSTVAVNKLLVKAGYLEQQTRQSSKTPDKLKKYWVLTDKGLKYGKNLISNKNQKETQPHYFVDSFDELMELIG